MAVWYIFKDNNQMGPLDESRLAEMELTPSTMVWREGMTQWLPASQVPELAYLFSGATYSTPPPHQTGYQQNCGPQQFGQSYQEPQPGYPGQNYYMSQSGKDKTVAGILAILLGGFGAQYFYVGKIGAGLITLVLTFVTCGIWPILMLAQGIIMLTMSQEQFDQKYVYSNSTLPLF